MELTVRIEVTDEELAVFEAIMRYPTLYLHCSQIRRVLLLECGMERKSNWVARRITSLTEKGLLERIGKKGSYSYRVNKNNLGRGKKY